MSNFTIRLEFQSDAKIDKIFSVSRVVLRVATYEIQTIFQPYNQSLAPQYTQFGSTSEKL
jgi:hypothetical protein